MAKKQLEDDLLTGGSLNADDKSAKKAAKAKKSAEKKAAKAAKNREKNEAKRAEIKKEIDALKAKKDDCDDEKEIEKLSGEIKKLSEKYSAVGANSNGLAPKTVKIIKSAVCIVIVVALLVTYVATGAVRKGFIASLSIPAQTFTGMTVSNKDGSEKAKIKVATYNYYFALTYNNLKGREIAVTLYLHATALLRQTQELTLLSDLYSTAYDLTYDAAPLELTSFREQFTRRQTVREVLEIGVVADSILALSVTCGAVSVSREGAGVVLRTGASVRALYLDEGGVPLVAERSIDVSCQLELPEDCRVAARAVCPEEVQGSLTDRGIEVRFPVDFRAEAAQRVKRVCVSAGKINTDAPKETTGAPSLVLRCLGKQETAWDLAKRYNTTIGVILAANQLETEGDISRDQLLLIPRKRT